MLLPWQQPRAPGSLSGPGPSSAPVVLGQPGPLHGRFWKRTNTRSQAPNPSLSFKQANQWCLSSLPALPLTCPVIWGLDRHPHSHLFLIACKVQSFELIIAQVPSSSNTDSLSATRKLPRISAQEGLFHFFPAQRREACGNARRLLEFFLCESS